MDYKLLEEEMYVEIDFEYVSDFDLNVFEEIDIYLIMVMSKSIIVL